MKRTFPLKRSTLTESGHQEEEKQLSHFIYFDAVLLSLSLLLLRWWTPGTNTSPASE